MKNVSKKTKADRTGMLQALQTEVIIDLFRGTALMGLSRTVGQRMILVQANPV